MCPPRATWPWWTPFASGAAITGHKVFLKKRCQIFRNSCQKSTKILNEIKQAVQTIPDISSEGLIVSMDELSNNDKTVLVERHLISREHAKRGAGSGLAINKEEKFIFDNWSTYCKSICTMSFLLAFT